MFSSHYFRLAGLRRTRQAMHKCMKTNSPVQNHRKPPSKQIPKQILTREYKQASIRGK